MPISLERIEEGEGESEDASKERNRQRDLDDEEHEESERLKAGRVPYAPTPESFDEHR